MDVDVDDSPVVLPVSWRSYLKAGFFSGVLLVFGIGLALSLSAGGRLVGVVTGLLGLVPLVDLIGTARRWRLVGHELILPRIWARDRRVVIDQAWHPGIDSVGRRDSIFQVQTPNGAELVHPNLLLARSDVRQWLHLIGERQRAR